MPFPKPASPRRPRIPRAAYYRWMFFAAGPVEAALSNKAFGFEVPAERQRAIGYGSIDDVVNALEHAVTQSEYIAGDRFTAADVYVGSQIGWGIMFGTLENGLLSKLIGSGSEAARLRSGRGRSTTRSRRRRHERQRAYWRSGIE